MPDHAPKVRWAWTPNGARTRISPSEFGYIRGLIQSEQHLVSDIYRHAYRKERRSRGALFLFALFCACTNAIRARFLFIYMKPIDEWRETLRHEDEPQDERFDEQESAK